MDMIKTYITCCYDNIAQYIATCLILDLFLAAERHPGAQVPKRWWQQGGLDWEGALEVERAEEEAGTETEEAGEDVEKDDNN